MIVSGNVNNNGIITANGNTVIGNHGGGGSGGSIWIDA